MNKFPPPEPEGSDAIHPSYVMPPEDEEENASSHNHDAASEKGELNGGKIIKTPPREPVAHPDPEQIEVCLPSLGRNERKFCTEIGKIIGPLNVAFMHNDRLAEVFDEPAPRGEENQLDRNNLARGGLKFRGFTGARMKGWIEQFITTGYMVKILGEDGKPLKDSDGNVQTEFKEKTISEALGRAIPESPFFQKRMPVIYRISPIPIPILTPQGDFRIPHPGFNPDLGIYCALNVPAIREMDLEEAVKALANAHLGFQFKNEQSRTHAYARLLTPYFRGIIGYGEPVPCWFYNANRPRAGKDYLAGITQITYEGFAFEDAAISDKADETCKRITAGLLAGRRQFHFANCQGFLNDKYFIQAITNQFWKVRLLGSNNAQSDLQIPNEAEYSLSANSGLTYRDDVEPRLRPIELVFYEEDANSRTFPVEDLHGSISRSKLLSACHSIFTHWVKSGCPDAHPFSSFKRWGKFVGGALKLASLGDPTLPHKGESIIGGNPRESAVKALYELCYKKHPEVWMEKVKIISLVAENQACEGQDKDDRLDWFGDLSNDETRKKAAQKIGQALSLYDHRWLSGIRLLIDNSQAKVTRRLLTFTKDPNKTT